MIGIGHGDGSAATLWVLAAATAPLWSWRQRTALRRVLLGRVDPRPLALARIAFGLSLLGLVSETLPLSDYLFSDEGLLPRAAVARARALPGLRPDGQLDWAVYLTSGKLSLLHGVDHPAIARACVAALGLAAVALALGWYTRIAAITSWLLLATLLRRGDAHYGGEQVFCGFAAILAVADSGAALSLDARRRGAHAVARWPQALLVLQLVLAYTVNGWVKTGPTWHSGDTLALALQVDRYARADWSSLVLALGPVPLRVATWAVLWWERTFAVVAVAWWVAARADAGLPVRARVHAVLTRAAALYLAFGLAFHLVSVVLFEFGAFVGATVSAYAVCGLRVPARWLRPVPLGPSSGATGMSARAWGGALACIALGGALALAAGVRAAWLGGWVVAAIIAVRSAGSGAVEHAAWAHGPRGGRLAGLLVGWHASALLLWQTPAAVPWREAARGMVERWMDISNTRQLWSMFAPNGPQRNQTLRTTVRVGDTIHDLRSELEHDQRLHWPYLVHERWRKIDEAVSGYREGLAIWHARWVCRRWALGHGGEVPTEVVLERVVAPIAPPDAPQRRQWFWAHAAVEPLVRLRCAEDPDAVLDATVAARYGLPRR